MTCDPTPDVSEQVTIVDESSFVRPNGETVTLPVQSPNLPLESDRMMSAQTPNNYDSNPDSMARRMKSPLVDISAGVTRFVPHLGRRQGTVAGSSDSSGPFFRTLTRAGYFGYGTIIQLPSNTDMFPLSALSNPKGGTYDDTCYIYVGGWAPNPNADDGVIDFGIQFSPKRRVWDIAGLFYRAGYDNQGNKLSSLRYSAPMGIPPGHIVGLSFYLNPRTGQEAAAGTATTRVRGVVKDYGTSGYTLENQIVVDFAVSISANWNVLGAGGTGQFFKRMVSIGQGKNQEGNHGTYFYHTQCNETNDTNWVERAVRTNDGGVSVPAGSTFPNYTNPNWSTPIGSGGPVYGYYEHPSGSSLSVTLPIGTVRVDSQYSFPSGILNLNMASIDTRGYAHS